MKYQIIECGEMTFVVKRRGLFTQFLTKNWGWSLRRWWAHEFGMFDEARDALLAELRREREESFARLREPVIRLEVEASEGFIISHSGPL